jgi:DNA-binding NtrC family response regulator
MDSDLARAAAHPLYILVVEDHALVQDLVVQLLKADGHHPLAVSDADQAFALWSEFPNAFSLVITDILMPSSLDGLMLGRLIQTHQPDLPVLYISGSEGSDGATPLVQGQNFFRKPFDPDQFLSVVERLVERCVAPDPDGARSGELAALAAG